jgi:hypothetical protein
LSAEIIVDPRIGSLHICAGGIARLKPKDLRRQGFGRKGLARRKIDNTDL